MTLRWKKQLVIDYQRTFGTPEGKRVLADLRKRCPLLMDSISLTGGVDVTVWAVKEGQRSVLLHIYRMLRRDPNEEQPPRALNDFTGE